MTAHTAFAERAYLATDIPAIVAMLNACDAVDHEDDSYTEEDLRSEFGSPTLDTANDLRLWHDGEQLVGLGQLWVDTDAERADIFHYWRVAPAHRDLGAEEQILAWAELRAQAIGVAGAVPALLRCGATEHDAARRERYERHGFAIDRYSYRMERDLRTPLPDRTLPDGFTIRPALGVEDAQRWVDCFNQSFIDHPHHHHYTIEDHLHELASDPNYRRELDLVVIADDGTYVGFCYCRIDADANARNGELVGWIDVLGTRRGYRGIGLGRALLRAGIHLLREAGMETVRLGVDANNPSGALGLYERNGFSRMFTRISYRKEFTV